MRIFWFAYLLWTASAQAALVDFQPLLVRGRSVVSRMPLGVADLRLRFENRTVDLTGSDLAHIIDCIAHDDYSDLADFGLSSESIPQILRLINKRNVADRSGREGSLQPFAEVVLDRTLLSGGKLSFEDWLKENVWTSFALSYSTKKATRSFLTAYAWALFLKTQEFEGKQLNWAIDNAARSLMWLNYKISKDKGLKPRDQIAFFEQLFVAVLRHTDLEDLPLVETLVVQARSQQKWSNWPFAGWAAATAASLGLLALVPDIGRLDPSWPIALFLTTPSGYKLWQALKKRESVESVSAGYTNARSQCADLFKLAEAG